MARARSKPPTHSRMRALPWVALLRGGMVVGERVYSLSDRDRRRLARLVRESRGWPGRLGLRERDELRRLVAKLDLNRLGRDLAPIVRETRLGRKRR